MSERCQNCGSELFAGQQFCRRCGAAVGGPGEDAPTRIFPQAAPTAAAGTPAATSQLGATPTDPTLDPRATSHQPSLAVLQQTSPLATAPAPPRRRGTALWLVALVALFIVGVIVGLAAMWVKTRKASRQPAVVVKQVGRGEKVPAAPAPPGLPEIIREAVEDSGLPVPLEEAGAVVRSDETVFSKTYEIEGGASLSIKAARGDVKVEGWDEPVAEVKVTKRGGSAEARAATRVLAARGDERLALTTAGTSDGVSVSYEIKLPRGLRQLEVHAGRGGVEVEGFEGTLVLDVQTGGVGLRDVTGTVRSNVIKGNTKVVYERAEREGPQEFRTNRGNVEVELPEGAAADVKAETLDGRINVGDGLGLKVEETAAGRHLVGRLGRGGEPLLIRVVNGDIKLTQ